MFTWAQQLADYLVFTLFGIAKSTHLGDALNFFIYDTIKIFILLLFITILMGIINSYFPVEKVRAALQKRKWYGLDYFIASFFGTITPFCSCSSVPLFIGFVQGGIPLGVTLAFLISSPLVDAVTVAMLLGIFGVRTTIIYVVSGILLAMIAGYILGKMKLDHLLTDWVKQIIANRQLKAMEAVQEKQSFFQRMPLIVKEAMDIIKGVGWYIVIGVAIGGLMHGYVPTGFFEQYITKENPLGVPLAVLIGLPIYSNTAGILPVMEVMVNKGVPLGTALAFTMSVTALSIPEAMLLKKVMTVKMLLIFLAVVTVCIMVSGYLFNIVL